MMGRGLLLLAICGCYAPHPLTGAPCDEEHPCPSGQECVANRCGGTAVTIDGDMTPADSSVPNPDAGPNDFDGDGIANTDDNCPNAANANQANEDGDPLGDACDPCPIDAASPPSDPDQDGVSDSCDPRPTTPGDTITLFEGFHHPLTSAWAVSGSAIVENDSLTLQGARIVTLPTPSTGTETLMAGITMVDPPVMGVWLGIPFDAGVGGAFCELTPTALEVFAEETTGTPPTQTGTVPYTATINTTYVVGMQRLGMMQFRCTVRAASSTTTTDVTGMSTHPAQVQNINVGCDAVARLSWVMLIANN